MNPRAGLKLPQQRARVGVERHEVAAHVSGEDESGRRGYRTGPKWRRTRRTPYHLPIHDVEGNEVTGIVTRQVLLVIGAQIPFAGRGRRERVFGPKLVTHRPLIGHEEEVLEVRVVGERLPIDRALEAGNNRSDLRAARDPDHVRVHVGTTGHGVETERPVDTGNDGLAVDELTRRCDRARKRNRSCRDGRAL